MVAWLNEKYPSDISKYRPEGMPSGRGAFKNSRGGNRKITLMASTSNTITQYIKDHPPHFLMNSTSVFQCISMYEAAYGLDDIKADQESGINITVMIMGLNESDGTWWAQDPERLRRLGWLLWKITSHRGVLALEESSGINQFPAPFPFKATDTVPDIVRQSESTFRNEGGIVGHQHVPRAAQRWGPGVLNIGLLKIHMLNAKKDDIKETGGSASGPPGNTSPGEKEYVGIDGKQREALLDYDVSGNPLRFNPVLHKLAMPRRVNFSDVPYGMDDYRSETGLERGLVLGDSGKAEGLKGLRLGRMFQHERSAGMAAVNTERYGFRFLYNPTSITISASRNDSLIIDPQSAIGAVVSGINQNFQVISFQAFLNRAPDVMGGNPTAEDYYTGVWDETDLTGIKQYGTHWDLEYLYRMCNGIFNQEDRGKSGDIGVLIPSNVRLLLSGGQNFFGFVESVTWQDQQFSPDMVPIHTTVDVTFRRHFDMQPKQLEEFWERVRLSGLGDATEDEGSGEGSDGGAPGTGPDDPIHRVNRPWWDANFPGWQQCTNGCVTYGGLDRKRHQGPQDGWVPPVLKQLEEDLRAKYPNWAGNAGIVGDYGHGSSNSNHNPVGFQRAPIYGRPGAAHAIDILIQGINANSVINALKNDPRTFEIIHKDFIMARWDGFKKRSYTKGGHETHIHLSLRSDTQEMAKHVEYDRTRWEF